MGEIDREFIEKNRHEIRQLQKLWEKVDTSKNKYSFISSNSVVSRGRDARDHYKKFKSRRQVDEDDKVLKPVVRKLPGYD